jgi:hypothetical protein
MDSDGMEFQARRSQIGWWTRSMTTAAKQPPQIVAAIASLSFSISLTTGSAILIEVVLL